MFGKKKKTPKVEKVFEGSSTEEQTTPADDNLSEEKLEEEAKNKTDEDLVGMFGDEAKEEESEDDNLTEGQREQVKRLNSVKDKISKILQSSNIEIVDENIGDEYESESGAGGEHSQQELDSLKALFGQKNKNKQELTLTLDDFDYTYIGQYLEEYDLMHLKNIKRIKLQRKYPKWFKKFLIATGVIAFVGIGIFLAIFLTRETPVYLKEVTLSQTHHDYYVDEVFDYTGIYLNLEYSDGSTQRVKLNKDHFKDKLGKVKLTGENNDDLQFENGTSANLIFTYQGFDVTYTVNILKKVEIGVSAIYSNGLFNLGANEYINSDYILPLVVYEGYGEKIMSLLQTSIDISVDGQKLEYVAKSGFKTVAPTTKESVIKITYQSKFSVEIRYNEDDEIDNYVTSVIENAE